jgi:peptide/nickel transport system permease protein
VTRYIVRRLLAAIPVMVVVATTVFLLLYLTPGDPVRVMLGPEATEEQVEQTRVQLGLDRPLHEQLFGWYGRLIRGDLGQSLFLNRPVTQAIAERAEPTLVLTTLASLVAIGLGLPLGILSAVRRGKLADTIAMVIAIGGVSMPTFWLGLNLILLFGVTLAVLPVAGYSPLSDGLWESLRYMIMPAITLGLAQGALLARVTRSMMLDTLGDDYIRTARAKGLAESGVVFVHALRNALIPLVTIMGLTFAVLMGGAVITEQVFNIPGVGRLLIQAISRRDYPVVQGVVLIIAGLYVFINLLVDILYAFLDPRLRLQEG